MLSNECFLPTAPVSRPSAPQMFTLVSTGLTSLTAFWEPLDPSNDIIYSYLLYCRAVEGSFYSGEPHPETDNIFNPIESTNVTHVTITGLNALADYECYVTASTGEVELEGVPSNTVRIRTGGFEDGEFHVCIVHAIMHTHTNGQMHKLGSCPYGSHIPGKARSPGHHFRDYGPTQNKLLKPGQVLAGALTVAPELVVWAPEVPATTG